MKNKLGFLLQSAKCGVFALVFSCVGVLLLALVAQIFSLSENLLPYINQGLKIVALVVALALCVKEEKFLLKCIVASVVFWLLSFVLFSLLGGQFNVVQLLVDLVLCLVAGVVVGIVKSKIN
ncbi:MAG: DUF3792 family protein [Clostridia bacterium]|nr:DUF3792 family protein [Clostridia bacterium]